MGNFKVKVDMPNLAEGALVEVPPFGRVENGSTVVVWTPHEIDLESFKDTFGVEIEATDEGATYPPEAPEAPPEDEEGGEE